MSINNNIKTVVSGSSTDISGLVEQSTYTTDKAALKAVNFRPLLKLDLNSVFGDTVIPVSINSNSQITDGVDIAPFDSNKFQLQGLDGSLLVPNAGHYTGVWPSGAAPVKWRSFFYTGRHLEVKLRTHVGSSILYVDGDHVATRQSNGANSPGHVYFDLGTGSAPRRIDFLSRNDFFNGFVVEPASSVWPTTDAQPKFAFIGDSITAGTGSLGLSWAAAAAIYLNSPGPYIHGVGGSGYLSGSIGLFINRIAEVVDNNPDYVVVCGGVNDSSRSVQDFSDAVDAFYTALLSSFEPQQIIICSPMSQGNSTPRVLDFRDVLQAKAGEIGCVFIDFLNGGTDGAITGTGDAGSPTGIGNADIMMTSDGAHPTQLGHNWLGQYFAMKFWEAIATSTT